MFTFHDLNIIEHNIIFLIILFNCIYFKKSLIFFSFQLSKQKSVIFKTQEILNVVLKQQSIPALKLLTVGAFKRLLGNEFQAFAILLEKMFFSNR
jgi:hypothetical protein